MSGFRKVWGGFEGVWACFGGSRWVKGGLLDPYRTLFAPLEVLYGTRYRTYWDLKRAYFAHLMAFWEPLGGFQRSGIGSVMPNLLKWASRTIMCCLEPNLVHTRLPEGQKVSYKGQADPL